jgi:transcriptional regulator with XRE-family HTH domain
VISGEGRPYTERGLVMDELARRRNVRGPYSIAGYMHDKLGDIVPTGPAVAKWMYGDCEPKTDKIQMFAEAFELTEDEKMQLAMAHAYGGKTPEGAQPRSRATWSS